MNFHLIPQAQLRVIDPCSNLTACYIERLEALIVELAKKVDEFEKDRKVTALFLDEAAGDLKSIYEDRLSRNLNDLAQLDRYRTQVESLLTVASSGSTTLFLPIGATVISKNEYALPDGRVHSSQGPCPVKGSKGVVAGFNEQGDRAVKVVFFTDVIDADGETTWEADRDGEPLFIPFHADELEVLSLATFADGSPCRSAEFIQTHISNEDDDDTQTMIVIADGTPVEITAYDFNDGIPWYQDAYAWDDLEKLKAFTPT